MTTIVTSSYSIQARRVPDRVVVQNTIVQLYSSILQEEKRHQNGQKELAAGFVFIVNFLKSRNTTYDVLVFSL